MTTVHSVSAWIDQLLFWFLAGRLTGSGAKSTDKGFVFCSSCAISCYGGFARICRSLVSIPIPVHPIIFLYHSHQVRFFFFWKVALNHWTWMLKFIPSSNCERNWSLSWNYSSIRKKNCQSQKDQTAVKLALFLPFIYYNGLNFSANKWHKEITGIITGKRGTE